MKETILGGGYILVFTITIAALLAHLTGPGKPFVVTKQSGGTFLSVQLHTVAIGTDRSTVATSSGIFQVEGAVSGIRDTPVEIRTTELSEFGTLKQLCVGQGSSASCFTVDDYMDNSIGSIGIPSIGISILIALVFIGTVIARDRSASLFIALAATFWGCFNTWAFFANK